MHSTVRNSVFCQGLFQLQINTHSVCVVMYQAYRQYLSVGSICGEKYRILPDLSLKHISLKNGTVMLESSYIHLLCFHRTDLQHRHFASSAGIVHLEYKAEAGDTDNGTSSQLVPPALLIFGPEPVRLKGARDQSLFTVLGHAVVVWESSTWTHVYPTPGSKTTGGGRSFSRFNLPFALLSVSMWSEHSVVFKRRSESLRGKAYSHATALTSTRSWGSIDCLVWPEGTTVCGLENNKLLVTPKVWVMWIMLSLRHMKVRNISASPKERLWVSATVTAHLADLPQTGGTAHCLPCFLPYEIELINL